MTTKEIRRLSISGWYGSIRARYRTGTVITRFVREDGSLDGIGRYFKIEEQLKFLMDNCPDTFELTDYEEARIRMDEQIVRVEYVYDHKEGR